MKMIVCVYSVGSVKTAHNVDHVRLTYSVNDDLLGKKYENLTLQILRKFGFSLMSFRAIVVCWN